MKTKTKLTILSTLAVSALCAGVAFLPSTVSAYAADTADTDVATTIVAVDEEGAQVRTEGEDGIRFFATVDRKTYDAAKAENASVRAGMILVKQDDLGEGLTHDNAKVLDIPANKWYEVADGAYTYTGVLIGAEKEGELSVFPQELYGKAIVARAYYYDGTDYTYSDKTVTRSIAKVASTSIAEDELETEEVTKLQAYIDGALKDATITLSGVTGDHINAGDSVTLTPENVTQYVQDGLVAQTWMVNDSSASVADGTVTTTQGANDLTVSVVYGSMMYSATFDVYAEYTKQFTYENYKGEYVALEEFAQTEKTYAKVGSTVAITDDLSDEKYLRGGGFEMNDVESLTSTAVEAKGTVLTAAFSQVALTGEGQLLDANNGTWQVKTSYNSAWTTNPVTVSKNTEIKESGKNSSMEIDWNGGYYTYVNFDTRNAITDFGEYNAIAFRMRNDATGFRVLYVQSVVGTSLSMQALTGYAAKQNTDYWGYYVLPLEKAVTAQDEVGLLIRFSNSFRNDGNGGTTGKTYLSDVKLINYETPENTLVDFGYSSLSSYVTSNNAAMAGDQSGNAYLGAGIEDPVTGGSTLLIQDKQFYKGCTGTYTRTVGNYGFFFWVNATSGGNPATGAGKALPYSKLESVWNDRGDAASVLLKFRVYCTAESGGSGDYAISINNGASWTFVKAAGGKIGAGQWTDVEILMTSLPTQNNARFHIAPSNGAACGRNMAETYISSITYEYIPAEYDYVNDTQWVRADELDATGYPAGSLSRSTEYVAEGRYSLKMTAKANKSPWFTVGYKFDWTNVESVSFKVFNPSNYTYSVKAEGVDLDSSNKEYRFGDANITVGVSNEWQTFTFNLDDSYASCDKIGFYISQNSNTDTDAWAALVSNGLYFDDFVITYKQ